jgi:very-short-patch-repair endonuclease
MNTKELKKAVENAIKGFNSKSFGRILKFSYPSLLAELERYTEGHNPGNIAESVYMLLKGFPPLCPNGSKPSFGGFDVGYRQYCGSHRVCECNRAAQSEKVRAWADNVSQEQKQAMVAKSQATSLERYGVKNPMQSQEVRQKLQEGNIEKYGVASHLQRPEVQEKIKQSLIEKYGVDAPLKDPAIQAKARATYEQRYGGLMVHARQAVVEKYDGKNPWQIEEVQTKRAETMLKKYGTVHALQNPDVFSQMVDNNIKKYGRPNPAQLHLSDELYNLLQNKETFLEEVKDRSSVQVAEKWNTRSDLVLRYARKHGVLDQMNFDPRSAMEDDLSEWLTQQGITFKRNDKKILNGLEIDILIPEYNLGIELNGLYQHSELAGEKSSEYHYHKTKGCEIKGIQLLHFWQDEYWQKKKIIQSKILYLCKRITNRIPARKLQLGLISDVKQEKEFLENNHIQGFADYRQWSTGAYQAGQLVGVMSFAHRKGRLELVRYATDINNVSSGLFTRLFQHSVREFEFSGEIISQSDNRVSNGGLYLASGWTLVREQAPDYCYTGDYATRSNKENFMKQKLMKKFGLSKEYVDAYTQDDIMKEMGWDRLWDAGKRVWRITV